MSVYLLCFDLSKPTEEQISQVLYWLDYLNSALPPPDSQDKFSILIVGLKADLQASPEDGLQSHHIRGWQRSHPRLAIFSQMLIVSSLGSIQSVRELIAVAEQECDRILTKHTTLVPDVYRTLLDELLKRRDPDGSIAKAIVHRDELFQMISNGMNERSFFVALKYFHAIGRIVVLKDYGLVCTDPTLIPKIAAKFISPEEVRRQLLKKGVIQILDKDEVGNLLDIDSSDDKYAHTTCSNNY